MAKRKPTLKPEPSSDKEENDQTEEEEEEEEEDEEEDSSDDEEEESEEEEEEVEEENVEDEEEEVKEEDFSSRDSIKMLLEPFGKDQLIELLKEAALNNPALVARISASAASDPAHRKIFVHGLGWDATTEALAAAFAPFGEIEECKAVLDRATGRCKGYGFVLFRDRASARRSLKDPQKQIGSRTTSCQLASFGVPTHPVPEGTGRKIFVNGVADNTNPDRLRAFFSKFGEIEDGPQGYDKATGKLRGFALFVYKSVEGCKKALEEPMKVFEGSQLHCQRALEGLKPKTPFPATGGSGVVPGVLQPNDLALTYAASSMMSVNPMTGLMGQNLNPGAGVSPSLGRVGTTQPPYGVGSGLGGFSSAINGTSPSVIGSYGSQGGLQGLGAYQSSQLSSTPPTRSQLGMGLGGTSLLPYFGR